MKSFSLLRSAPLMLILGACVAVPPAPPPAAPPPPPAPPAQVTPADWRDWPVAPGNWTYRAVVGGTIATFGQPGQPAQISFRCDSATRGIAVSTFSTLPAAQISGQMTIRTSYGATSWPVVASNGSATDPVYAVATRASNDPALDRIAYSRGRFGLEAPGTAPSAFPAWAEVSRSEEHTSELQSH